MVKPTEALADRPRADLVVHTNFTEAEIDKMIEWSAELFDLKESTISAKCLYPHTKHCRARSHRGPQADATKANKVCCPDPRSADPCIQCTLPVGSERTAAACYMQYQHPGPAQCAARVDYLH
jgi:hypothetical protein